VEAARREALCYERRAVKEGRRFRVFTNSMSDFFEDRADLVEARQEALDIILTTPHLDWLILTKRPDKILTLLAQAQKLALEGDMGFAYTASGTNRLSEWLGWWLSGKPPANVWLGTTVEDQERADLRIPALLQVPAEARFLSCEPLLGPVDLPHWINLPRPVAGDWPIGHTTIAESGLHKVARNPHGARSVIASNGRELGIKPDECKDLGLGLDWVICGGESGPHARPMHPDWARGLRDQCAAAGVPFLFKQWGEFEDTGRHGPRPGDWAVWPDGNGVVLSGGQFPASREAAVMRKVGKARSGRHLDGMEHNGFPQLTNSSA
jgi:protein gp37